MGNNLIQLAVDLLDFDAVIKLVNQVKDEIDIFEIGTPCIKYNGINLLRTLRKVVPNHKILVDLKTMDAGEYEAAPFFEAGADICTVLGAADLSTIKGVVKAANKFHKECQVDVINVANKEKRMKEAVESGVHIVGIHTGLDQQAEGKTPFADLQSARSLGLNAKISVAGGIKVDTLKACLDAGANIIVVGAAIYAAKDPKAVAHEMHSIVQGYTAQVKAA